MTVPHIVAGRKSRRLDMQIAEPQCCIWRLFPDQDFHL